MNNISIIPKPLNFIVQDGNFNLSKNTIILKSAFVAPVPKATEFLAEIIEKDTGLTLFISNECSSSIDSSILLEYNDSLIDEAYALQIMMGQITINASDYSGFFYGIQTFRQLLLGSKIDKYCHLDSYLIPCLNINDKPRFKWRGFMLDSARNFQSVDSIKRYLDYLSFLKMNHFHWHLVDSQGWRIEIKKYPELTEIGAWRGDGEDREGGWYSQDEITDILNYAEKRNITVIPEIEMPAHSDAAIYCFPQLSCSGKPFALSDVVHTQFEMDGDKESKRNFCAGKEEVFEFLEDVLTEVIELFDGPYIHIGGDERVRDIWSECEFCKKRMEENGLKNEHELQKYFINRIVGFIRGKGKKVISWAENPELGIPDDIIVHAWRKDDEKIATEQGFQVINSNNPYYYLDYYEYEHMQGTDWLAPLDLQKVYEYEPDPESIKNNDGEIMGIEAPLWTSWVEEFEIEKFMFPRLLAIAENAWYAGNDQKDFPKFRARVNEFEKIIAFLGAKFAKPLAEEPVSLLLPGEVKTSIPPFKGFVPEKAFDHSLYHYFWSENSPKKDDYFLINLDDIIISGQIKVYSGECGSSNCTLNNAVLEISENGADFAKVADFDGKRKVTVEFPIQQIKLLRIKFTEGLEQRIAIRGIFFDSQQESILLNTPNNKRMVLDEKRTLQEVV